MKKVLAAVLAAAMSLSMASVAFAVTVAPVNPVGTGATGDDFVLGDNVLLTDLNHKDEIDVEDHRIYTFGTGAAEDMTFVFDVAKKTKLRADVADGKISVSTKKIGTYGEGDAQYTTYEITVKPKWGVRDFKNDNKWKVELDIGGDGDKVVYIKGKGGYSDTQVVTSGDRFAVRKSGDTTDGTSGSIFDFSEVIDEETRIRCHDYVDVYFKGNYGTDKENLRVVTDKISDVEKYFDDSDIDCYDFVGTPKFATKVRVIIDGDSNAYLYEYNKNTGDITAVDAEYTSDGWSFTTKNLGTYILAEEEYEGGNVKKEEVEDKEPVSAPDKTNPGTGANDMVGVAAALAVVSLVAAGAVAFKKASK